ncbi:MAG: M20/M25/M40 family metallo-hydrolase, partial [Saprospiraceae bacterium]|nr:M20/M25/M40 family metallo-hydrolase [Saprospiraceae bacterium]
MKTNKTISPDLAQSVLAELQRQRDEMVAFLKSLVLRETPSRVMESQDAIFQLLDHNLRALDFYTLRMPGKKTGGYLFARPNNRRKGREIQLLLGHCDTVWDIGTLEQMPYRENSEKLAGPGIYDMKAGLTQIIFALKAIRNLQWDIN